MDRDPRVERLGQEFVVFGLVALLIALWFAPDLPIVNFW